MLYQIISKLYDKKVDAFGLSLFRIAIGTVLFAEVFKLLFYRRLIFDVTPYLEFTAIVDYKYALIAWLGAIVFLILGLFTRIVVIINYVFSLVFFATNTEFGTHMIKVFMSINFLLLFTNVSKVWSLDAVLVKLQYPQKEIDTKVAVLNYYCFVFIAIGLAYFVSLFDKYFTSLWLNGMVFYVYRSLPDFGTFNIQFLLNQKWIMMVFTYFALVFETIFIFVCFNRKLRPYICFGGMALHFGIFLFLPAPEFALGFMALYLLMVPFRYWKALGGTFRAKSSTTLLLNSHHPMSASVDVIIRSFDVFRYFNVLLLNKPDHSSNSNALVLGFRPNKNITSACDIVAYIMLRIPVFSLLGLLLYIPIINTVLLKYYKLLLVYSITIVKNTTNNTLVRPKVNSILKRLKVNMLVIACLLIVLLQANAVLKTRFAKTIGLPEKNIRLYKLSSALFGITNHNVFTDTFDKGALYGIGIAYEVKTDSCIWLPLTKINGEIGAYKKGSLFYKGRFRNFESDLDTLKLKKYTKDFTAFWSFENNIDLDNADFNVYIKKYDVPKEWQKDVYNSNRDMPWISLGKVIWRDTLFYPQLDLGKVP